MNINTMAFKNTYRKVKGMEKIYILDNDFCFWSRLYKIHSIHIFKDYDYEEWKDITNIKILLSTSDESFSVEFLFINIVSFHLNDVDGISDFEIAPNDDTAFENERLFWVTGDEGYSLSFFCKEIEIVNASQGVSCCRTNA